MSTPEPTSEWYTKLDADYPGWAEFRAPEGRLLFRDADELERIADGWQAIAFGLHGLGFEKLAERAADVRNKYLGAAEWNRSPWMSATARVSAALLGIAGVWATMREAEP